MTAVLAGDFVLSTTIGDSAGKVAETCGVERSKLKRWIGRGTISTRVKVATVHR